jgi:hypothetical protein
MVAEFPRSGDVEMEMWRCGWCDVGLGDVEMRASKK